MISLTRQKWIGFVMSLALGLSACHRLQPVYNVQDHPVPHAAQQKLTEDKIGETIARAAFATGWHVDLVNSGLFHATIKWQDHSATADIRYSQQSFSILLDTSRNLKEGDGEIHRRYNQQVQQLEDEIDRQLYRAAF